MFEVDGSGTSGGWLMESLKDFLETCWLGSPGQYFVKEVCIPFRPTSGPDSAAVPIRVSSARRSPPVIIVNAIIVQEYAGAGSLSFPIITRLIPLVFWIIHLLFLFLFYFINPFIHFYLPGLNATVSIIFESAVDLVK